MKVIRYVTLFETVEEEGVRYDITTKDNATLPIILNPYKIAAIEPYFTKDGRQYKNVSVISYDTGEKFKVVGNYDDLNGRLYKRNTNPIGFRYGQQRQEEIENGTKVKSKIKRGTETSSD